jgi:hypothetical protein
MKEAPEAELPEKHNDPFRSRCAMLVSVLAMVLAIAGLGGSNAAKESTLNNILAANAYAFYQAKNIRQTEYKIAADNLQLQLAQDKLTPKAKELEHERNHALAQDPWFDYAEALLQIAIVLTSVAILTGVHALFWIPSGLGILGILSTINGFMLIV